MRSAHDPDGLRLAIDPATCAVSDLVDELRFAAFWCAEADGGPPAGLEAQRRSAQVRAVLEAAAGRLAQRGEQPDRADAPRHAQDAARGCVARARADAARLHADAQAAVGELLVALAEVAEAEQALRSALARLAP